MLRPALYTIICVLAHDEFYVRIDEITFLWIFSTSSKLEMLKQLIMLVNIRTCIRWTFCSAITLKQRNGLKLIED